ncbi:MAG: hypothetical protein AB1744_11035 [Candidatus Zixiibacteriota bacterium]
MTAQTRKKLVYLALAAAIIWGAYNNPFGGRTKRRIVEPEAAVDTVTAVPTAVHQQQIPVKEMTAKPWGADPFRPILKTQATAARTAEWRLTGILYHGETPLAIINGRPVRSGEVVDNARVVEIRRQSVTIDHKGSIVTLTVTKG